jgi:transcriptional regulator with XRE-family HTH domain
MTTAVVGREALLKRTEEIEENLTAAKPASAARASYESRNVWCRSLENAVLDLCNVLPEGTTDFEAKLLLGYVVELRRAIADDTDAVDADGRVEHKRLQMLDVVKRMERKIMHDRLDFPDHAAAYIFEKLESLTATELAEILGVSTRTIAAWRKGGPVKTNAPQVAAVAQIVFNLGRSMTARGIWLWFRSEQDKLGGKTPLVLLAAGLKKNREDWVTAVQTLARGGRGQLAN